MISFFSSFLKDSYGDYKFGILVAASTLFFLPLCLFPFFLGADAFLPLFFLYLVGGISLGVFLAARHTYNEGDNGLALALLILFPFTLFYFIYICYECFLFFFMGVPF